MASRRIASGGVAALVLCAACAAAARAEVPSPLLQDRVEEALSSNFVRPETAIWRFEDMKSYTGSGAVVCGSVNYESSAHKYLGFHRFYAIIEDSKVTLAQVSDPTQDTSGRLEEKLHVLCDKG